MTAINLAFSAPTWELGLKQRLRFGFLFANRIFFRLFSLLLLYWLRYLEIYQVVLFQQHLSFVAWNFSILGFF